MATIPQSEIDFQLSHKDAYNAQGLNGFLIFGTCFSTLMVGLRLWARRGVLKIGWHADDYTIIAAQIITIASAVCFLIMTYHFGYGRHYLTLPVYQQRGFTKTDYAYNILYTVGYPLSKISLTLLYRRIFILRWFNICCWILIFIFAGYAISTALVDIFLTIPINAYWNHDVKPHRSVDEVALYKANAWFNIITDAILLFLPLSVIWRLQMSLPRRLGLTFMFAIGVLTVVATIMRLVLFSQVNVFDTSWTLTSLAFWTAGEQFLGVICACLPTLRPIVQLGWERYSSRGSRDTPRSNPSVTERVTWRELHNQRSDRTLRKDPDQIPLEVPETAVILQALDPRYRGSGMGNRSDALFDDHSRRTLEGRDEEEILPLPGNAIGVAKAFNVQDEQVSSVR